MAARFHEAKQSLALRTYLIRKLDGVDEANTSQHTILCTWIAQIYLSALSGSARGGRDNINGTGGGGGDGADLASEFAEFLTHHQRHLHTTTTCRLATAHGSQSLPTLLK